MDFNNFSEVDGKMADNICYVYIFHLTWPMSLHYLLKSGCSKFLPNTGFVTIRLLRFGVKVKRAYCRNNFLAQRPLSDMRRLSGDDFLMFQEDGTLAHQRATPSLSWSEKDTRNASSSRRLCPFTGHISSTNSDDFEPICHNN